LENQAEENKDDGTSAKEEKQEEDADESGNR